MVTSRGSSLSTTSGAKVRSSLADEPVVHGADREQHRHRRAPAAAASSSTASRAGADSRLGLRDDPLERRLEPLAGREGGVETLGVEPLDTVGGKSRKLGSSMPPARLRALDQRAASRAPSSVRSEKTMRSRRWSIGGFVTCAKRWRK